MSAFVDKLDAACALNQSLVCVGLDTDPARIPIPDALEFNRQIIEATADLVCAYKPNLAFYEAMGLEGLRILEKTVRLIPGHIVTIADAKRGDIGSTAQAYAKGIFDYLGFDALTLSPYLGRDSLEPFWDYKDKGAFILCRTSNPGSGDFQSLRVDGGAPLYQEVARRVKEWNAYGNLGLVVGATYPKELQQVRAMCSALPILIPGVGAQGGDLRSSVRNGVDEQGRRAIINSSRQIIYASQGKDYPQAARRAAEALRKDINLALEAMGHRW